VLDNLIEDGFVPVVATVAAGDDGGSFNVNADLVAGEIAAALGADKIIFLTDVDGLYKDFSDKSSLISALSANEAREMIMNDELEGGMVPKVAACMKAVDNGVRRAHILNGTVQHALLLEVYTDEGVGTMIADDANQEGH
ncbi:MAG TPA: acetylglutamate kinase, partial [Coriobacteriia bacterium]|nr:acetylglutamate kinase [Coriobacteriia bacterium]